MNAIIEKILHLNLSMLPAEVIEHFGYCIAECERNNIEGDIIEAGVWKGGACIYAQHVMKELDSKRRLFVADSFEGHDIPDPICFPMDAEGPKNWEMEHFKVNLASVQHNFLAFGQIEPFIRFVPGFFSETIPLLDTGPLAVMRLDGDNYEPTIVCLEHLYPRLSPGGFCIIDDYGHVGRAQQATLDFREFNGITDEIQLIKHPGKYPHAFWQKS